MGRLTGYYSGASDKKLSKKGKGCGKGSREWLGSSELVVEKGREIGCFGFLDVSAVLSFISARNVTCVFPAEGRRSR